MAEVLTNTAPPLTLLVMLQTKHPQVTTKFNDYYQTFDEDICPSCTRFHPDMLLGSDPPQQWTRTVNSQRYPCPSSSGIRISLMLERQPILHVFPPIANKKTCEEKSDSIIMAACHSLCVSPSIDNHTIHNLTKVSLHSTSDA